MTQPPDSPEMKAAVALGRKARISWARENPYLSGNDEKEIQMSHPKLFQYAVILHPSDDEVSEGKGSELVVELKTVLAMDDKQAAVLAGRDIPEQHLDKLNRLEVAVRPF